jgi:hypothetical protein
LILICPIIFTRFSCPQNCYIIYILSPFFPYLLYCIVLYCTALYRTTCTDLPVLTLLRTVLPVRSVQAGLPSKALSLWTRRGTALRCVIQVRGGDTDGWPFWEWKVVSSNHTIPKDTFKFPCPHPPSSSKMDGCIEYVGVK